MVAIAQQSLIALQDRTHVIEKEIESIQKVIALPSGSWRCMLSEYRCMLSQ